MTTTRLTVQEELDHLRAMLEIRFFEDECHRMFAQGLVRGSTHLGKGQEAVAVGACSAARAGDTMTCTYRGHAAVLAMGAPLDAAFGEILGKPAGSAAGKAARCTSPTCRVACSAPSPSSARTSRSRPASPSPPATAAPATVTVCFFGDGATNIGAFHEALNLARSGSSR